MRPIDTLICIAAALLLLAAASLALRGKDESIRARALIIASIATMIGFFAYKCALSADAEFDALTAGTGGFNWWGELPLHLCNINMILIPIAVRFKRRGLMSFCFFVGPLGALMALLMPGTGFAGYSPLLPRMLGYYGTHLAILVEGLALVTFGLYKPKLRDLPLTVLTLLLIALAVFGVNLLLRASGLHPRANYFFTVETEGNALLELFYGWIPVPYLYLMPGIVILAGYMALVMGAFAATERLRKSGTH